MESTKIFLKEEDMPRKWYNIAADLPHPVPPPLHPGTRQPAGPQDLAPLFPMALIEQEMSTQQFIQIPDEIQEIYRLWRPSPLIRARRLEKHLKTPAKIYFKYEGVSPAGSHKPNTAIPQAYYNKEAGVKRITTETGAGQWGSALSLACTFFNIECKVYMVKVSYDLKPFRRSMIHTWGATVIPSPSNQTAAGRKVLAEHPDSPGSLGIAISEAVEEAASREDTKYALGSVLNHVLLHQTIIGQEAQKQFEMIGDYPDVVIGCVGGGSNFAGLAFPFVRDKINGKEIQFIAVEPSACPTLTRGPYAYDYGDIAGMTPMLAMNTLGHGFVPPPIHSGGLRYHGVAPLISQLLRDKLIEAESYDQIQTFEAGVLFSRLEGILPAPESNHAIKSAMEAAIRAREEGKEKTILFNLSGHGHFDMSSYDAYFAGELTKYSLPDAEINRALSEISDFPKP